MPEMSLPFHEGIHSFYNFPEDTQLKIIQLGLLLYEQGILQTQTWNNERWQIQIDELLTKHQTQMSYVNEALEQEKRNFERYKQTSESQQTMYIEQAIRREREIQKTQIQQLTQTNSDLLSRMNRLQSEIEEKYLSRLMESSKAHQEILLQQRDREDTLRQDYETRLSRQQNSSLRGRDGEDVVMEQLTILFPKADVEDTHATPHRGDFIVRHDDMTVMIETKNYSRNVQKAEIDKFYSDIDNPSNRDVQCGLFVSLHTGICNKDDFQFEIRNNVPILFIHGLYSNFGSLRIAMSFFKMLIEQKNIDLTHKETIDAFKHIASSLKRNFQKQKTSLDRYYSTQIEFITSQQSNLTELYGILKQKY